MKTTDLIIWVLFIGALVFLGYFFARRMRKNKVIRQEMQNQYEERRRKYTYLKPGIFDECPREDVPAAALFHCIRKEDEDFEGYFDKLSYSEKVIYGIYQVSLSLEGQGASLHSFFLSPSSRPYVPIVADIFAEVGAHEIADLLKAARRFSEIIENDEDDDEDDPEMGDYSRYNFSDFTHEFVSLVNSTNLNDKITDYILTHKEDFYDTDIPKEYLEDGDEIDEGISE